MISVEHAREIRAIMEAQAAALDDNVALSVPEMFPKWSDSAEYKKDDRVRYQGILYRCIQPHTSQATYTPTDATSLWTRVLIPDPEVIPEWIQPESTNPYMNGDKVTHNGQTWESTIDYNVWEPGVYGWEVAE